MKKGDIVTGVVSKTSFPNKGEVVVEGEVIQVKNVIEGQVISLQVQKKRKGRWQGRYLSLKEASSLEDQDSFCVHNGECGGCSYQTLSPKALCRMKEKQVNTLLKPILSNLEDIQEESIIPCEEAFHYRNKMELSFGDSYKGGPLALGMHKKGSHYDIVNLEECHLMTEDMYTVTRATRDYFADFYPHTIGFYHGQTHQGYLRHLLLRQSSATGGILVDLVTTSQSKTFNENELLLGWQKSLEKLNLKGYIQGILHTRNDSLADVVKDEGTQILFGEDMIEEEILGLTFKITPFSFFQPNTKGACAIYRKVQEYVGDTKDKVIYDLYCGTGTISQILAKVARKVVGVEIVKEAVEAAKENATKNGLTNCEFIAEDVLKVIDTLEKRSQKPDIMVLDPPREGIHPKAIDKLLAFGVEKIIYVSCKPTSLARDLEIILQHGYQVEKFCICDQFYGTVHVECVVLLERK